MFIVAHLAIDYIYLKDKGTLVIYEAQNAFTSNTEKPKKLYAGFSQIDGCVALLNKHLNLDEKLLHIKEDKSLSFKDKTGKDLEGVVLCVNDAVDVSGRLKDRTNSKLTICNAHFVPILGTKYLFNLHCDRFLAIKKFVPKTRYATRSTVEHVKRDLSPNKTYAIKMSDQHGGEGMQFLKREEMSSEKIFSHPDFIKTPHIQIYEEHTILIQEEAKGDLVRDEKTKKMVERTRRVYILAFGEIDSDKPLQMYQHCQYYTIGDSEEPFKYNLDANETKLLGKFVNAFLKNLYDPKQRRFPNQWEYILDEFIQNNNKFSTGDRAIKLALLTQALNQESLYSFEKITPINLKNISILFKILTPKEKQIHFQNFIRFFKYALIGDTDFQLVHDFANPELVDAFKKFANGLKPEQIDFLYGYVAERRKLAESPHHCLHCNIKVLSQLFEFLKVEVNKDHKADASQSQFKSTGPKFFQTLSQIPKEALALVICTEIVRRSKEPENASPGKADGKTSNAFPSQFRVAALRQNATKQEADAFLDQMLEEFDSSLPPIPRP